MKKIEHVIVMADYSTEGMNTTRTAIKICRRHDAHMHLIFVHDTDYLFPTAGMQAPVLGLSQEIIAGEIDNLNTYALSIERNYGINCTPHHELGSAYAVIHRTTRRLKCDMLVVTNKGRGSALRSSTGYQALKAATCPVLILHGEQIDRFRNIVLPIRQVPNALDKLSITYNMARKNNAHVYIVGALDKQDKAGFNKIKMMVNTAKKRLAAIKIPCSYEINAGNGVVPGILAACKDRSADLVVITASTKRAFNQFFSGNYAERMINQSPSPILCIKPGILSAKREAGFMHAHSMLV